MQKGNALGAEWAFCDKPPRILKEYADMMKNLLAILLGLSIGAAPLVASAEGGFQNPFSFKRNKKAPTAARAKNTNAGGWGMPRLWPWGGNETAQQQPAGPTTWQKMTSGTKNIINTTADTLNPFNDANDNPPEPGLTGSNTMFSQAANSRKPEEKSKSFLPSWLGGAKEEEQRPSTVNEFLLQEKPSFNN
jgi:hypothetical protein